MHFELLDRLPNAVHFDTAEAVTRNFVKAAEDAGEMLLKLVPSIGRTAELVKNVASASEEQSKGLEQVNKALQQLDQVTQQNAMASQQICKHVRGTGGTGRDSSVFN